MDNRTIRRFLFWCIVLNSGMLLIWMAMIVSAGDAIHYMADGRFFSLTETQFYEIQFEAFAHYKMAIYFFNIIPFFALLIMDKYRSKASPKDPNGPAR